MENQNQPSGLDVFDHVVVLMLENRSFDNLLGYLYQPGEVPSGKTFEGLYNPKVDYANPIPARANNDSGKTSIAPVRADNYSMPYPDPGEEYPHVNTQLFNQIDQDNVGIIDYKMQPPYNLPNPVPTPGMIGFVNDYESNLRSTYNIDNPPYEEYQVIMQCFQPDQIPVLATLAKEFAVFDHWYCSVPSQTYCNRAFWHAASSAGKVINPLEEDGSGFPGLDGDFWGMESWIENVWPLTTLFDRMNDNQVNWKVYSPIFPISLTNIIHGFSLDHEWHTHEYSDFAYDLQNNSLPAYSFVEPKFLGQHNDQHPSSVNHELATGTVKLGEELILEVYNAIKNSPYRDNTLLIITHDEHGGCYDHVPPPAAVPPVPGMKGQCDFTFDRLGVRVPMVMVSSYIAPNTIMNGQFEHTSFIKTMCQKWGLDPLTDRDKDPSVLPFTEVFSSQMRSWPDIPAQSPVVDLALEPDKTNDPLNGLQKAMLTSLLHLEKKYGLGITSVADVQTIGDMMQFIERFKSMI